MTIISKNITLRTVEISDAEFIYDMRRDENKSKYLSKITTSLESQREWILNYKVKEKAKEEYYFVITSKNNENLGLVRVYDFKNDSFCWGSWLIKNNAPKTTAIESALQIYEFAFYKLGFEKSHFDVRKGNDKVIAFHKRFGAVVIDEDEKELFFNYTKLAYEKIKDRYRRYLE